MYSQNLVRMRVVGSVPRLEFKRRGQVPGVSLPPLQRHIFTRRKGGPGLNALLESHLSHSPSLQNGALEKIAQLQMAGEKKTGRDPLWAFLYGCLCLCVLEAQTSLFPAWIQSRGLCGRHGSGHHTHWIWSAGSATHAHEFSG